METVIRRCAVNLILPLCLGLLQDEGYRGTGREALEVVSVTLSMNRVIQILIIPLLLSFLILSGMTIWFAQQVAPTIQTTLRDAHVIILEAGLTLKNLREASEEWKKASQAQAQQTTSAMSRVSAAAEGLSSFISSTDRSI